MNNNHTSLVNILFSSLVLLAAFVVLQPFLLPLLWAAVIAITTWPLHVWVRTWLGGRSSLAAVCSTLVVALLLVVPMVVLLVYAAEDVHSLVSFLIGANEKGAPAPVWLAKVPLVGEFLTAKWLQYLAEPNQLTDLFSARLGYIQEMANSVLLEVASRVARLFFALWALFFIYRDGEILVRRVSLIGFKWLKNRWPSYAYHIPSAVRSAVNGLVLVGLAEGVIISLMLRFFGVHSAELLGALTAVLALVPLAGPLLLALIGMFLAAQGSPLNGIFVFIFGTAVLMLADYMLRPQLIQGGTALPFLAILFGIFGGIAAMGLLGLIIGPVVLVLFMVLLREAALDESVEMEF